MGEAVGDGAGSMICPAKVRRSTMVAQRRGSVKVLVQPENASLLAIAIAERSSRSVKTWKRSSAPRRSSSNPCIAGWELVFLRTLLQRWS
jgi:hypothetical protein